MKRILFATLLVASGLAVAACEPETVADRQNAVREQADKALDSSVIRCKDGRQIRVAILSPKFDTQAMAVWPVTDDQGRPKLCVKRAVDRPVDYEEVPDEAPAASQNTGERSAQ